MSTDPLLIASTLATRMRVHQRDRWNGTRVLAFQRVALGRLLRHARTSSPYYREAFGGPRTSRSQNCRSSANPR
jgi:hypothetical protein